MTSQYSLPYILSRRSYALIFGVLAFPFVCWFPVRSRLYSYLYRLWFKTSTEPVWLTRSREIEDSQI